MSALFTVTFQANPDCFYGEDCDACNPVGIYDGDDDRKPPWAYRDDEK